MEREAAIAHAVYLAEQRHPVEVSADDATHLVNWLSQRLDRRLQAPDFTAAGFELLGGRLLAGESGYALSGSLDKRSLLNLATLAYHQLGNG